MTLGLALMSAGCGDIRPTVEAELPPPPQELLQQGSIAAPEVEGLWLRGGTSGRLTMILRFTQPMDTDSVESSLRLLRAGRRVFGPDDGEALAREGRAVWDPLGRELTATFAPAGTSAVVLTIAPSALDAEGRPLDGTTGPRPETDPASFHRLADDGFAGPASYVSLPYYPAGTADLADRPSFLQHDARPRLRCALPGSTAVTSAADLGVWDGETPLTCRLADFRRAPARPMVVERLEPRAWRPDAVPTAELQPEAGSPVSTSVAFGRDGSVPIRVDWVVDGLLGGNGLRIRGLTLDEAADLDGLILWSPSRDTLLLPVTGHTAPDILWVTETLATGAARTLSSLEIGDPTQAWAADELVGHRFTWDTLDVRIAGNAGAKLRFEQVVSCTPCDPYTVRTRLAALFVPGSPVRLASPWLRISSETPPPSGLYTLRFSGGLDREGLPLYDERRDGDETSGRVDDRIDYTLRVE